MLPPRSQRSYDRHMKLWRRKVVPVAAKSDLTRTAGRFWSPDSPWNTPVDPETEPDPTAKAKLLEQCWDITLGVVACAPRVVYASPHDRIRVVVERSPHLEAITVAGRIPTNLELLPPDATLVVVDLEARTVLSGTRWQGRALADDLLGIDWTCEALDRADLDDDGWDSLAGGLVLEREILSGSIPHVIALDCPDPAYYGRRVRIPASADLRRVKRGHPGALIARALKDYGGIIVGHTDEPSLVVHCERSASATHDNVGISYVSVGIGRDRHSLMFPIDVIEVEAV